MHYTDSWPEAAKEAFKERMREEVKEEIRDEMEGCDEERYYSWVDLLDNDFDDEIDSMNLNDKDNTTLKFLHLLTTQQTELASVVIKLEERLRVIDYNLWQFKDFYAQKNGPFEHKSRKDYE